MIRNTTEFIDAYNHYEKTGGNVEYAIETAVNAFIEFTVWDAIYTTAMMKPSKISDQELEEIDGRVQILFEQKGWSTGCKLMLIEALGSLSTLAPIGRQYGKDTIATNAIFSVYTLLRSLTNEPMINLLEKHYGSK